MCFYDQQIFSCNDHKWGRFRAHCNKEYRTGETCGMKLIYEATRVNGKCQNCKKYEVTWRKIVQATERVARWEAEGINPVSTDKERLNIAAWQKELKDMELLKQTKMRTI
ncbi:uncharacterized protein LAJ45_01917 [Morchella importuna]|uniref:Uncharacterized protein n=1 Tax=Morchella conica CCBAS932 TaxID=1392247 RepID=A0A3N4LFZ9_9PEZI|nr:uncharacterized protein H6S33_000547 [Morchella sextelata]XP_045975453.1 uncharacterized protein LAJ45_01917 [Morchella importuna]KAI5852878.1 hypothetical protein DFP73DRAFT_20759 [Morchella snyderi]RPB16875.1 hypothetical protein P167DRAFT_531818 [Morchella conica CCBAS932]KAH0614911.1 hypothetical protein H6S33_000547 [Morchella sextelata]KAH8154149.1 hypothetical protein LAJ45_01917 [Morchella importuna]